MVFGDVTNATQSSRAHLAWSPLLRAAVYETAAFSDRVPLAVVAACPGWRAVDVVHHLGSVYAHTRALIALRPAAAARVRAEVPPEPPPTLPLVRWLGRLVDELCAELTVTPADAAVWSWGRTAGRPLFWARRITHETLVHACDVASAVGERYDIAPSLAADGVDEFLTEFVPLQLSRRGGLGEEPDSYLFWASDEGVGWRVDLSNGAAQVEPVFQAFPSSTGRYLEARAQDLLLALWGRGGSVDASAAFRKWQVLVGAP